MLPGRLHIAQVGIAVPSPQETNRQVLQPPASRRCGCSYMEATCMSGTFIRVDFAFGQCLPNMAHENCLGQGSPITEEEEKPRCWTPERDITKQFRDLAQEQYKRPIKTSTPLCNWSHLKCLRCTLMMAGGDPLSTATSLRTG